MELRPTHPAANPQIASQPSAAPQFDVASADDSELRKNFTQFVGETLFGSMLASMRKSVGKPAYMHGGRTEEVFQSQLDQAIVEELTEASADTIANPMYELFYLQQRP